MVRRVTRVPRLEDSPHEVGDQGEYDNHESSNPDQESGGQLRRFDFLFVHEG
jgi:hypothetical protein